MSRATRRAHQGEAERERLIERGWEEVEEGAWRHPALENLWPTGYALELETEWDRGVPDARRMLGGPQCRTRP